MSTPTLYFAYGSNLSLSQMASRCPTSTYVALARLDGWKWIIGERGYANVIPSPPSPTTSNFTLRGKPLPPPDSESDSQEKDYVIGMLYTLEPADEENLDLAEGVPFAYVKQIHDVALLDGSGKETGEWKSVLVYVDVKRVREGVCKEEYVGRMNRGVRDARAKGMSASYVEKYLRPFVREEDVPAEVEDPFAPEKGGDIYADE